MDTTTLLPPLSTDVTPKAHNHVLTRLRSRSLADRLHTTMQLSERMITLSLAGMCGRDPSLSRAAARVALVGYCYGQEAAHRLRTHLEHGTMTNIDAEWHEVVGAVVGVLEDIGVAHYLTGSVASSTHGLPRGTNDVDIVAEITVAQVPILVSRLSPLGHLDPDEMRAAIRQRGMFNMLPNAGPLRIDFILPPQRLFQTAIFDRMRYVYLGDGPRPYLLPSVEDMILVKIEWYHTGGQQATSEQWKDILGMIQLQAATLDQSYLTRWATILGLSATLRRALSEAGIAP